MVNGGLVLEVRAGDYFPNQRLPSVSNSRMNKMLGQCCTSGNGAVCSVVMDSVLEVYAHSVCVVGAVCCRCLPTQNPVILEIFLVAGNGSSNAPVGL
jgi:hypothetical protein